MLADATCDGKKKMSSSSDGRALHVLQLPQTPVLGKPWNPGWENCTRSRLCWKNERQAHNDEAIREQ